MNYRILLFGLICCPCLFGMSDSKPDDDQLIRKESFSATAPDIFEKNQRYSLEKIELKSDKSNLVETLKNICDQKTSCFYEPEVLKIANILFDAEQKNTKQTTEHNPELDLLQYFSQYLSETEKVTFQTDGFIKPDKSFKIEDEYLRKFAENIVRLTSLNNSKKIENFTIAMQAYIAVYVHKIEKKDQQLFRQIKSAIKQAVNKN